MEDKPLVVQAFHVAYWDYIGWKDPYANARYAERQRDVARAQGKTFVYTPQVVFVGLGGKADRACVNSRVSRLARLLQSCTISELWYARSETLPACSPNCADTIPSRA